MRKHLWGAGAIVSLLALLGATSSECDECQNVQYRLVPVQEFGWSEIADSTRVLSDLERRYGGAVFGATTDIVMGPGGLLYVLDNSFQKIVVFDSAANFVRLIVGGVGDGPGEFRRPRSVTMGPGGGPWVNDMVARRLIRFSPGGEPAGRAHLEGRIVLGLAAGREHVYGALLRRSPGPAVAVFDSSMALIGEMGGMLPRDTLLRSNVGMAAALGEGTDGSVIVAYPTIGEWQRISPDGLSERLGSNLRPDARLIDYTDPEYGVRTVTPQAEPIHAGQLNDGRIYVLYRASESDVPARGAYHLALFSTTGGLLGQVDSVKVGSGAALTHSLSEPAFYIGITDLYPKVVKYRLEEH